MRHLPFGHLPFIIYLVIGLLSLVVNPLCAQSNLTYELKVGTTGEVAVISSFLESYQGEKVNISVQAANADSVQTASLADLDFIIVESAEVPEGFAEVYVFNDENGAEWHVYRNEKEIKNRTKRVLVQNAYSAFEAYLHEQLDVHRSHGWIWWVFAAVMLLGVCGYSVATLWQRKQEKNLTPVEQEILRRKRMGRRRHYGSQLYLWLLLVVLYAPIALIAVFSFTESKVLGNWTGFSMNLYANLFTGKADAGLNSAIMYTLVIALVAAFCSTILGTLAAIGIYNMRARQRKVVSLMNSIPMINPDIITGISLFLLFVALHSERKKPHNSTNPQLP